MHFISQTALIWMKIVFTVQFVTGIKSFFFFKKPVNISFKFQVYLLSNKQCATFTSQASYK